MMFSIFGHVNKKNRLPLMADDSDSDSETHRPPVQYNFTSLARTERMSSPLFVTSKTHSPDGLQQQQQPPPLLSDPSEAEEISATEELQIGQPQARNGTWVLEALRREPSPPSPVKQPSPPMELNSPRIDFVEQKLQKCLKHREYCLKIRRSMRGRLLLTAPVQKRNGTRYISPMTWDDLKTVVVRASSASPVSPATPATPSPAGRRSTRARTARQSNSDKESARKRPTPKLQGTRNNGVTKRGARNSKVPLSAVTDQLSTLLSDPNSSDNAIALLVSSWTSSLISKADNLSQASRAKDIKVSSLEANNSRLETQIADLLTKNHDLKSRVARLEPANSDAQGEITVLNARIDQISSKAAADNSKVERLNAQLASLYRGSQASKHKFETEIGVLKGEIAILKEGARADALTSKIISTQFSMSISEMELKGQYEKLEGMAKEVVRVCGMMASHNFGDMGVALMNLKGLVDKEK